LGDPRKPIRILILHEDRSVIAIDKPAGWLLIPFNWQSTARNLQAAITSSIAARDFWAKSRNLKFLRAVHRLDGETTGVLLLARNLGAVDTYSDLFESRRMSKRYLAVVDGTPKEPEWTCRARLAPDPRRVGRIHIDPRNGKEAETHFRLLQTLGSRSLVEACPVTGRTHQIRVHLLEAGCPVIGDALYGRPNESASTLSAKHPPPLQGINKTRGSGTGPWSGRPQFPLGLRAVGLRYADPFLRRTVDIQAPTKDFLAAFGFASP
jgi:RluA family pseudouridine synthase